MEREKKQKMMEIVAKLLLLSMNDGATEAEKANAGAKARAIMLKYGIAQAEAMGKKTADDLNGDTNRQDLETFDGADWEVMLAAGIATGFDCTCVTPYNNAKVYFVGMKDDLELVIYFYNRLLRYIYSAGQKEYPQTSHVKKRQSYCYGMESKVCMRLKDLYKKVKEEMPTECKALMVIKKDAVSKRVRREFGPLGNGKATQRPDMDAYYKGMKDGDKVSLHSNKTRVGD